MHRREAGEEFRIRPNRDGDAVNVGGVDDGLLIVFRTAIASIWRVKLFLAIWVAVCVGVALIYASSMQSSYVASASLLLEARRQTTMTSSQEAGLINTLDIPLAESQLEVIRSERLLAYVFDSLNLLSSSDLNTSQPSFYSRFIAGIGALTGKYQVNGANLDEKRELAFANFRDRINVRRIGVSYVVEVSYTSGDPTLARRVANAIASAYLAQSLAFKADAARNGADFLQSRVNALTEEVRSANLAVLSGTVPASPTPDADARIISAALQPLGRASPRVGLITSFGGSLGALSAFIFISVANAFNRRIYSPHELKQLNVRCLGVIPEVERRTRMRRRSENEMGMVVLSQPTSEFAVAMRNVRAAVSLVSPQSSGKNTGIALVSWLPESGSTMICCNLAHMIQVSGHPVTLIDLDVHRTGQGLTARSQAVEVSLSDVLLGRAQPSELEVVDLDGLALVPARSKNREAVHRTYLGVQEMAQVVSHFTSSGEVILDLPPLSTAGDALLAAACAGSVVLLVAAGRTTKDDVISALDALADARANVIGVVINRATSR
ncbi:MAG: hypothetical protein ACRYGP_13555 [Janthinobacterium lividum]